MGRRKTYKEFSDSSRSEVDAEYRSDKENESTEEEENEDEKIGEENEIEEDYENKEDNHEAVQHNPREVLDAMIERIDSMPDWEYPDFSSRNKGFLAVIKETKRIRNECHVDDYKELIAETTAFTENEEMIKAFIQFRDISQFVMHIHNQYDVPLVPITKETKHIDLVRDTIRHVLGK